MTNFISICSLWIFKEIIFIIVLIWYIACVYQKCNDVLENQVDTSYREKSKIIQQYLIPLCQKHNTNNHTKQWLHTPFSCQLEWSLSPAIHNPAKLINVGSIQSEGPNAAATQTISFYCWAMLINPKWPLIKEGLSCRWRGDRCGGKRQTGKLLRVRDLSVYSAVTLCAFQPGSNGELQKTTAQPCAREAVRTTDMKVLCDSSAGGHTGRLLSGLRKSSSIVPLSHRS